MADDKLKAGPESPGEGSVGDAQTVTKPPVPETVEEPAAGTGPVRQPEQSVTPGMGGDVPAQPAPQVEADKVEKSPDQDKKVEPEEKTAKRRGRPPKEQDSPQGDKPEKGPEPRTGRPAKADKAARGKSPSPALDKVSRGKEQELTPAQRGGKTRRERNQNVKDFLAGKRETPFADGKQPPKSTKGAPVKEAEAPAPEIKLPPTPEVPPRPVEQGGIILFGAAQVHGAGDAGYPAPAGVLPHPVPAGRAFAPVVRQPEVKGGQRVHVQGSICKMGVGVYHGVQAPVLQLPCRPGNKGGERVRCQGTQTGILHVDGSGQLKPLSPEGIVQEGQLGIPLWGSNGTAVIVDPHRDAQPDAGRVVCFKHGVDVGRAVPAAQCAQHHAVDPAAGFYGIPVYAALPAGDIHNFSHSVLLTV